MVHTYPGLPPIVKLSSEVKTSLVNKILQCPTHCQYVCCTCDCKKLFNNKILKEAAHKKLYLKRKEESNLQTQFSIRRGEDK